MTAEGGPWGIVIIISAFMIQVFTFGVSSAIGVYNIEFLEHFGVSASKVSLVAALNFGAFLGSGPIVSFLMTKFSYRKIVLCGSALIVLALLTVPIFPNLYMMYVTIGLLVGFGCCCAYIPSHTLSGLYYDKYRSLATGVATSGSGIGLAVMPVFTAWFIEIYAWRGSFVILAGLCLHLFIFGALLRMPPASSLVKTEKEDLLLQNNCTAVNKNQTDFDHSGKLSGERKVSDDLTGEYNGFTMDASGSNVALNRLQKDDSRLLEHGVDDVSRLQDGNLHTDPSVKIEQERAPLPESARHIYIFKNYNFVIYFINNYFWNASTSMVAAFGPEYFRLKGFSIIEVSYLMGGFGLGTFVGGILGGVLGNIKRIDRTFLFILSCCLLGVFTLLIPLGKSIPYFAFSTLSIGLFFGIILGLLIVVLADLVGIESLGNGMGYLMLSNGLGTFTGPVYAGMLIDATENYESSIYLSGVLSIISAVAMSFIPLRHRFKSCKNVPVSMEPND